jgi:hypothetical protein
VRATSSGGVGCPLSLGDIARIEVSRGGVTMAGTREMVANAIADTLLPVFRRPMEDVVYETLDRRDVPTRPEMRDYVDASVDPGLQKRVLELEAKVAELEARGADLETRLATLERRPTVAGERRVEPALAPGTQAKACKVRGCTEPHRSRGYCARHYQQWRRGVLEVPTG